MKRPMLKSANEYICYKRNLGYAFGSDAWMLKSFGKYADTTANGAPLTIKLALKWAVLP